MEDDWEDETPHGWGTGAMAEAAPQKPTQSFSNNGFSNSGFSNNSSFGDNQSFGGNQNRGGSFRGGGNRGDNGFGRGGGRGSYRGGGGNRGGFGSEDRGGGRGFGNSRSFGGDNEQGGGGYRSGGFNNRDNDNGGGFGGSRGGGGFNQSSGGGFGSSGGGFQSDNGGSGFGNNDGGFRGGRGSGRGRGGGRGGGGNRFDNDDGGNGGGFGGNNGSNDFGGGRFSNDNGGDRQGNGDGSDAPKKELYIPPDISTEEKDLFEGYSAGINFNKYDKIKVEVNGDDPPPPILDFVQGGLRDILVQNVKKAKYTKPTPVQKYAIPFIKNRRDLMACAQTGSGKTAAFLLPIMHVLLEDKDQVEVSATGAVQPLCIILSPTRELAMQIYREAMKFAHETILKIGLIYGGTASYHQMEKISRGCHILVATPGRLGDYINRGRLSYEKIKFIVLDEADRMLDMGFQQDIERMMKNPDMPQPGSKTTVMFSATFPREIQVIASKYLDKYLYVVVGMVGGACADVTQEFLEVPKFNKREKLLEILKGTPPGHRVMVFVETKKTCDFVAAYLCQSEVSSTSIHGDREQAQREGAIRDFTKGKHCVLVATNVAARGIDIAGVELVINYDLPKEVDDYVHRIGRTGRVGHTGTAISFFDQQYDQNLVPNMIKILTQAEQNIPEWLLRYSGGAMSGGFSFQSGGGSADIRNSASAGFAPSSQPAGEDEW